MPCESQFLRPTMRCRACAAPVLPEAAAAQALCAPCLREPLPLSRTWAAVDYGFPWRNLLLRLKHQEPGLATALAGLWKNSGAGTQAGAWAAAQADTQPSDATAAQQALSNVAWVLPVPASAARMQIRGYNHSRLLAQAWCVQSNSPGRLARSAWLLRVDEPATPQPATQQGASRAQRFRQLRNAFVVPPQARSAVQGQRILLIDDVMTTGATLSAAASALRQAGAADVCALVLARTASS